MADARGADRAWLGAEQVPFSAIQRTIRAELGKDPALVFSFIDPTPLATASIAQVEHNHLKPKP